MKTTRIQQFSIIFFFIMLSWAMLPFFGFGTLDDVSIATSIVLILIAVAYPLVLIKPQWNKSLLFCEGIIFAAVGFILIKSLAILMIIGLVLVILSILAYMRKLPKSLLKFFYKTPK